MIVNEAKTNSMTLKEHVFLYLNFFKYQDIFWDMLTFKPARFKQVLQQLISTKQGHIYWALLAVYVCFTVTHQEGPRFTDTLLTKVNRFPWIIDNFTFLLLLMHTMHSEEITKGTN